MVAGFALPRHLISIQHTRSAVTIGQYSFSGGVLMKLISVFLLLVSFGTTVLSAELPTITVTVSPGQIDRPHAPVRVNVDSVLTEYGENIQSNGYYLVRETDTGVVVPNRASWTRSGKDAGTVIFRKTGTGVKQYTVTVLNEPPYASTPIPVVGLGEPMTYGRTGLVTHIDGSFNSRVVAADWDRDGDIDLFVAEGMGGGATATMHGLHYFENIGSPDTPLMAQPAWINHDSGTPACVDWNGDDLLDVISGGQLLINEGPVGGLDFRCDSLALDGVPSFQAVADWNGDGLFDLIRTISVGGGDPSPSTWSKDLWSGPFTSEGVWRGYDGRGRLLVYRNVGTITEPRFGDADTVCIDDPVVGKHVLDVVTGGDPALGDLDGDGDLDLLIGNRFDLYWFENIGTHTNPRFRQGYALDVHLEEIYIRPFIVDLTGDGRPDVLIGQENGDVRILENLGMDDANRPILLPPRPLRQLDPFINMGSCGPFDLADLNGDGKPDIIGGNSYGEVWQWLSIPGAPEWTFGEGKRVSAGGEPIRVYAGPAGSIQGPGEARYGYVAPTLVDWDQDGIIDMILCDVWGKNRFYRAISLTSDGPVFSAEEMLRFADPKDVIKPVWNWWNPEDDELVTQWRQRSQALDWDDDGLIDYITMDHEGYLALFGAVMTPHGKRLRAAQRIFLDDQGEPLRLNIGLNGRSGRYKINLVDWDGDGDLDLFRGVAEPSGNRLVDPEHERGTALFWENVGEMRFVARGEIIRDPNFRLAGHSASPLAYDIDGDGELDLLIGAEDGHIYAFHRAFLVHDLPTVTIDEVTVHKTR